MIVGARSGCRPRHLLALLEGHRGQPREDPLAFLAGSAVAVDLGRGRRARGPGRSRPARSRCRPRRSPCWTARALRLGDGRGEDPLHVVGQLPLLVLGRRIVVEVALGLAHDAGLGGDVEAHLVSRRRSPSRSSRRRCRTRASASRSCGSRSLVAPRNVSRASSSPVRMWGSSPKRSLTVAGELLAVGRVAHRAGQHGQTPRRRRGARSSRRYPASVSNTRSIASSRRRPSLSTPAPSRVTVLTRSSSSVTRPSLDVGDQQPGRVRADVDDGDAAHACHRVGHRLAGQRGQQVVDRHVGHPLARGVGGRADVGDDDQVGRAEQRIVGRERLGIGDVERGAGDRPVLQRLRAAPPGRRSARGRC